MGRSPITRELKLAHLLASLTLFATVTTVSGGLTVAGLKYSADAVGSMAAAAPVKTSNLRQGYVASLRVAKANDLNVAQSVPVTPAAQKVPAQAAASPVPTYTHVVAVEALRVRAGPKKTEPQVFTLKGGSWVNISDNVRGWVKITDAAGKTGWVYGSLLRQTASRE